MADIANPDFLCVFVGPGFVSTSLSFMRSSASHPAGPHGRLSQTTVNRGGGWFGGHYILTKFSQQFVFAVLAPPLVGCVVCSHNILIIFDDVSLNCMKKMIKTWRLMIPCMLVYNFNTINYHLNSDTVIQLLWNTSRIAHSKCSHSYLNHRP